MSAITRRPLEAEPWDPAWGRGTPWGPVEGEPTEAYRALQAWLDWTGTLREFAKARDLPLHRVLGWSGVWGWDRRRAAYASHLGEIADAERAEAARRGARSAVAVLDSALEAVALEIQFGKKLSQAEAIRLAPEIVKAQELLAGRATARVTVDLEGLSEEQKLDLERTLDLVKK